MKMNKIIITLGCAAFITGHSELKAQKPNIIFIISDDHGIDALGCYGNPVIQTPHLDKLADEGVKFSNAFCTSASCSASRSVILTGKYGHATGHYGHAHDYHHFSTYDTITSLPVYMSADGYHTARIGKYHLAPESVYKFDTVLPGNARSTVEMADNCKEVINSEEPFFLYYCTSDPHRGYPYKMDNWQTPNNFGNIEEGYAGVEEVVYDPADVLVPDFLPDAKESREELAQYYQSVSRLDQGVGRLMKHLDESGKTENTIIIYISDNGIAFPGAKTTLYDPGMQLPCIIKLPGDGPKGITNSAMINWADLTPSILDMAGIEIKDKHFHGKSFKSILKEENPEAWDEVYASHIFHEITMYYPMRVYRDKKYKLIWNVAWEMEYPFASDLWISSTWQGVLKREDQFYGKREVSKYLHREKFELYDIENNPDETINLAAMEEYQDLLESLIVKMKDFQQKTADPWIIIWENNAVMQRNTERL